MVSEKRGLYNGTGFDSMKCGLKMFGFQIAPEIHFYKDQSFEFVLLVQRVTNNQNKLS